ncbi:MAG: hypothetical protein AAB511_01445 [Patescibacteria group bacterium]
MNRSRPDRCSEIRDEELLPAIQATIGFSFVGFVLNIGINQIPLIGYLLTIIVTLLIGAFIGSIEVPGLAKWLIGICTIAGCIVGFHIKHDADWLTSVLTSLAPLITFSIGFWYSTRPDTDKVERKR